MSPWDTPTSQHWHKLVTFTQKISNHVVQNQALGPLPPHTPASAWFSYAQNTLARIVQNHTLIRYTQIL